MSNNDYVIFIKKKRGDFEPVDSAETKEEGIEVAKTYLENPKVLEAEVVYMPNDDYDVEETVWNSSKNIDESNKENAGAEEDSAQSKQEFIGNSAEDTLQELFGFGKKKKDTLNRYSIRLNQDTSGRIATSDLWDELYWVVKDHVSSVKKTLSDSYASMFEFVATEQEFEDIKADIDHKLRQLPRRYLSGVDTINSKGVENPDVKDSLAQLLTFKCIERDIKESLEEDTEDDAWSEEEVRAELIKMTNNFKKNEGEITTWYEEEKEHIKSILDAAGYQVEVSDGRKDKDDDMHWVITFVKKVNESLTENSNVKLALELIDNDEDNMVAVYKVSSGKDALSLAIETIGYTNGTDESGLKIRKEDIKKLEVVSSLSEGNDITDVFIDIDENKDLVYCGKFNSGDYTNVDKIIKVIEDWSDGTIIEESLKEDTNISIDKVEIDVDTLNTKTKKIDEDVAFDKDKKLTIREMYDFLLKSGMSNGCDIILDWDNDSDLSDPKTAIEWLDLIIETYYDLDSDLRYMHAEDEAERNMDQVIVPLEDFRNELNEKGLAQLNNIYYQVLSYNNDSGDDDFDDYDNYGAAEAAFENWVNDYKEDGVDGAVELLQVDDNNRTSKQLKYWSSEDDNAWKFDEGLNDNGVIDYGCDKCGKRVPEDKIHWFYGAEVGLCNDCHGKITDEECYQLDDGDFSFLDLKF